MLSRNGKERQQESHEPVRAHLEQDCRQYDGPRRRCLYVGVRQPGVERENGNLYGERQCEGSEQPHLLSRCQGDLEQVHEGEGRHAEQHLAPGVDVEDSYEHQERSDRRVEEELYGGIDPPLSSPDSDDEVHRNERELEEHVEEKQVHGREHSHDPDLEEKHERVERLLSLLDVVERPQDGERGREGAQHDHEQADPVEAERIVHTPLGNPRPATLELIPPAQGRIIGPPKSYAQDEDHEAPAQGKFLGPIFGSPEDVDHPEEREPNQCVEHPTVVCQCVQHLQQDHREYDQHTDGQDKRVGIHLTRLEQADHPPQRSSPVAHQIDRPVDDRGIHDPPQDSGGG